MNREETKKIIHIIAATYPSFKPSNLTELVDVWTMLLDEFSYNECANALKNYIYTSKSQFAPSVGEIINEIKTMSEIGSEIGELEAWDMVRRAIGNSCYNSQSEFERLPTVIRRTIGSPSQLKQWAMSEIDEVETVIQSNFTRSYRAKVEQQKKINRMPVDVQRKIEMQRGLSIGENK